MVAGAYRVVWTPAFAEEVFLAVEYVQDQLGMPKAARDLLRGVTEALEQKDELPSAAAKRRTPNGTEFYVTSYKRYNIYYVIDGDLVKAVALRHQLQKDQP